MNGLLLRSKEFKLPIEIIYIKQNGEFIQRVITVIEITDFYIKAYCHYRQMTRTFTRKNILSLQPYHSWKKTI